jgi:hypothetical protein
MTSLCQFPRPIVRATAGFKDDQAGVLSGHECGELLSRELFAKLYFSCPQGAVDLKNILCQINPNHHILHLAVLLVVWLLTPQPWHKSMPSWEGGNHSI